MSQVPFQTNGKDCGCFLIYFARKFLSDPDATIAIIKVVSSFHSKYVVLADISCQKSFFFFRSKDEMLDAWGLKSLDLSFVRQDLRTLLLECVAKRYVTVEYKQE